MFKILEESVYKILALIGIVVPLSHKISFILNENQEHFIPVIHF